MSIKGLLIYVILFFAVASAQAEVKSVGIPFIRNYPKEEYRAGTQNWDIAQDQRGFVYFANGGGVLNYNGVNWSIYNIPNNSTVKSLHVTESGNIYVGAYNELGKMVVEKNGQMRYLSLKRFIPEEFRNFDDVWKVFPYQDKIVFHTYNGAFFCKNDSVFSVVKAPSRFLNSFQVGESVFFNDLESGLLEFDGTNLIPVMGCEAIKGEEIRSILPFGRDHRLVIGTLNQGLFIFDGAVLREWNVPVNNFLKKNQIYCSSVIHDHYYVYGTVQDGIVIIDEQGEVKQHLNKKKGLQNNTILSLFSDRDGNLWLGLDNGIDFVNINSSISFLQNDEGIGAGYTSTIYEGKLYLGTNQGLFVQSWGSSGTDYEYRMIPGTSGQVWYLGIHDGVLLCGHNNGTFEVKGEQARLIDRTPGIWKYHTLRRFPDKLIAGTYSGLIVFKKFNGSWVFENKIVGFNESSRVFEEDSNGDLWISHGFKGIYRIKFGKDLSVVESYRFYTQKEGLPSNYNLSVAKINGKIVFTSNAGIYEYNKTNDYFESSKDFNQLVEPDKDISFIKEDNDGNIWYITLNRLKLLQLGDRGEYKSVTSPFAQLSGKFMSGFEHIHIYSKDHIFLGLENGFAHYAVSSQLREIQSFSAYIERAAALHADSVFYYGNGSLLQVNEAMSEFQFPYKRNAFRFTYSSPIYDNYGSIEFSYKLLGYDERWSAWSNTTVTEYTNLPAGSYTFMVRARNQAGIESETDSIVFQILPPWYRSLFAYIVYVILSVSLGFLAVFLVLKRVEISKRKERLKHLRSYRQKEQEYKQEALIAEKKIMNLQNEKLKAEMIHRDKELANQTMDLIRKNKFLVKIKDELIKIKGSSNDASQKDRISLLVNKIDRDIDHEKQWEVFETAFDEVHEDFLNRLKAQYPDLTPKELRLCAYLRMNISTKEIAPLMNISIRGVEICRYRVRKKLNIDRDTNLTSLIMEL